MEDRSWLRYCPFPDDVRVVTDDHRRSKSLSVELFDGGIPMRQRLGFLEPNTRAGAQKACVQSAKVNRDVCLQGTTPPTCQESCQAFYNNEVVSCEAQFNPAFCMGSPTCISIISGQLAACIDTATTAFNSCVAACPVQ